MIASYAEYAHLLNLVNEKASCKFCDTHDIWTVAQVSRGRIGRSRRALARALSWEIFTLNRAGVLAISPAEESFFRSFVTSRVEFLPPWFDVHTRPKEPIRKDFDLVYVGSRNQLNIEGLRWFLQKVLPNFPDLTRLLAGAGAFIYPSLYEGFGLPPLEAMACGTPCIVSEATSIPEVVGDAAVKVKPADVANMASAILEVLKDHTHQKRLRNAGLARASMFTWKSSAEQTSEFLRRF